MTGSASASIGTGLMMAWTVRRDIRDEQYPDSSEDNICIESRCGGSDVAK